jgi:hypothetical protein
MFLPEKDIEPVMSELKTAFPQLSEWEYCNEDDDFHGGFTAWGCLTLEDKDEKPLSERSFYVTFDIFGKEAPGRWRGTLTIGQHSYFWSDADAGDAYLLYTGGCDSLSDAIAALKTKIRDFASALSAI